MPEFSSVSISAIVAVIDGVRKKKPLVHCLTNNVVKQFTANALLAAGAAPAMVEHPDEGQEFAAMADALLINLGTLDEAQMRCMLRAVPSSLAASRPWVFDPVAVGALSVRTEFARRLLEFSPTMIRANASEILALAGLEGGGRGVDSGASSSAALHAAEVLAGKYRSTVLVTGEIDYVVSEDSRCALANGHVLLTRVTGTGCAMGALAAACLAVADSPFLAAVATAAWMGIAGELAAENAAGPGTFQIALLDALDALDGSEVEERLRLSDQD